MGRSFVWDSQRGSLSDSFEGIVVGGGTAASVAARFAAKRDWGATHLEVRDPQKLWLSVIQLPCFEKPLGVEIPPDRLGSDLLFRAEMASLSGQVVCGQVRMLNSWRAGLDRWPNMVAEEAGTTLEGETRVVGFASGVLVYPCACEDGFGIEMFGPAT